jgi:cardiolipin synthase A/B
MKKSRRKTNLIPFSLKKAALTAIVSLLLVFASWVTNSITSPPLLPDSTHPIELYANQARHDLQHTFASAILGAKDSVLLIIYSLSDSNVIHALKEKSEQGIPVMVICDPKASRRVEQKVGPLVDTVKRFTDGLMHQKILVIDKKQVLLGSANMTTESLRNHGNLVMGFESPSLAAVIDQKAKAMKADTSGAIPHQEAILGTQKAELWFLPDDAQAIHRVKQMIQSAQKTLKIAMFTWTRYDLAKEVIEAAKRGVAVEVVIDKQSGHGASAKVVKMLKQGGIPVRLSTGSALLHHKFAYIDNATLINGSANWTKAAFTQNDDCFIILHDLNSKQRKILNTMWDVIASESRKE